MAILDQCKNSWRQNNNHATRTGTTTPFLYRNLKNIGQFLGPWVLQPVQETPSEWPNLHTMSPILEKGGMNICEAKSLPKPLTLKCGYDSPENDRSRQKKLCTNLSEKKVGRERWSDKWPRVMLRSQCNLLGDHVRDSNGETGLVLFITQVEILLEASNTSVSCNWMTSVTVHVATECLLLPILVWS